MDRALKNRHRPFIIGGEAVLLTFHGISDFDALHSRRHDALLQLYAFAILMLDGEDLRGRCPARAKDPPGAAAGALLGGDFPRPI